MVLWWSAMWNTLLSTMLRALEIQSAFELGSPTYPFRTWDRHANVEVSR